MKARIATICQAGRFFNSVQENRNYVMGLLDLALRQKPDLVCLPENFVTVSVNKPKSEIAEPVPGPTTDAVAQRAKANKCYIICPLTTTRNAKLWNSAVVIDRSGEILGIYDKACPVTSSSDYTVFEGGITPGNSEIPVFDLDFGRIGIQICFDIGFPENWEKLSQKEAKIVFWPSAYNGGFPLQVYAYLHHYYVISSVRSDKSKIIDPLGRIIAETDRLANIIYRDINLDFVVVHYDFNYSIPDKITKAYPGRVEIRSHLDDGHFLVEPIDDTLTTDQLKKEFGFESTFQYHQRHREAYQLIRQGKPPIAQKAAHGDRPQYSKVDD
jgi:predicted amidohydrolase